MSKSKKLMAVGLRAAAMREENKGRGVYRTKRDDWELAPKVLDDLYFNSMQARAARFNQLSVSDLKKCRIGIVCLRGGQQWICWNTKIKNVRMPTGNSHLTFEMENWFPHVAVKATHGVVADEAKNVLCIIPFFYEAAVCETDYLGLSLSVACTKVTTWR